MAGLGRQFLTINGNALHETSGFTIDTKTVEKTFMSEDGYDKSILIRTGKHVFSPSWTGATSAHKALCETFCSLPTVTLVFDGGTYTCRARNLKTKLVRYSNRWDGSNGLWDISFTLEEI